MAPKAAADTQNVLDLMTAGIMGRKAEKAAKLTPVGAEVPVVHSVIPDQIEAPYPNDMPTQELGRALVIITDQVGYILEAVAAIRAAAGIQATAQAVDLDAERKARETAAEERIAAQRVTTPQTEAIIARLQGAKEQAATFEVEKQLVKAAVATADEAVATALDGWVCPTHGTAEVRRSRKGREFRACPSCEEFERL